MAAPRSHMIQSVCNETGTRLDVNVASSLVVTILSTPAFPQPATFTLQQPCTITVTGTIPVVLNNPVAKGEFSWSVGTASGVFSVTVAGKMFFRNTGSVGSAYFTLIGAAGSTGAFPLKWGEAIDTQVYRDVTTPVAWIADTATTIVGYTYL